MESKNFKVISEMLSEELGIQVSSITMDSKLIDDLKADSITMMVIIGNIQDEFGIDVPDEAIKEIVTVGDIVRYLDKIA